MTEKWGEVEIHKDKERGGDNSNTVFEARKLGGGVPCGPVKQVTEQARQAVQKQAGLAVRTQSAQEMNTPGKWKTYLGNEKNPGLPQKSKPIADFRGQHLPTSNHQTFTEC